MKKTKRTPGKFLATPLALLILSRYLLACNILPEDLLALKACLEKGNKTSFCKTYLKARAVSVKYNQSRISTQDKLKSINDDKQKKRLVLLANKFLTDPNKVY